MNGDGKPGCFAIGRRAGSIDFRPGLMDPTVMANAAVEGLISFDSSLNKQ